MIIANKLSSLLHALSTTHIYAIEKALYCWVEVQIKDSFATYMQQAKVDNNKLLKVLNLLVSPPYLARLVQMIAKQYQQYQMIL